MSNGISYLLRRRHAVADAGAPPAAGGFDFSELVIGPHPVAYAALVSGNPAGFARPAGGAGPQAAGPIIGGGGGAAPPAYSPNVGPVASSPNAALAFGAPVFGAPVMADLTPAGGPFAVETPPVATLPPGDPGIVAPVVPGPSSSPPPARLDPFGGLDPAIATAMAAQPAAPVAAPPPAPILTPRGGTNIAV